MTDAEKLLWSKIRRKQFKGCQFYRQAIIGNYIVDFYCPEAKLVIEIDGGQHYHGDRSQDDKVRDLQLSSLGLKVFRYSNLEVLENIDMVMEHIYENLNPPVSGLTRVSLRSRDFCAVSQLRPIPHLLGIVPLCQRGKINYEHKNRTPLKKCSEVNVLREYNASPTIAMNKSNRSLLDNGNFVNVLREYNASPRGFEPLLPA